MTDIDVQIQVRFSLKKLKPSSALLASRTKITMHRFILKVICFEEVRETIITADITGNVQYSCVLGGRMELSELSRMQPTDI